ncbi:uncharacterized protein HD556DRAFT_1523489 [Suillus plorans]|uniref:AAA ATPase AAA+ lid domain-containing protein n=1 Tax=Suillus plorans TaxID=116603 RepID=A0A9P7DWI5_9AGAM|nr:uncharacterized protein HD556DRAFT_1523489 [Suillus plorans]KAG1805021.1 hypothetical protein HD556DRAFT_1523489 [Suillus plorans]
MFEPPSITALAYPSTITLSFPYNTSQHIVHIHPIQPPVLLSATACSGRWRFGSTGAFKSTKNMKGYQGYGSYRCAAVDILDSALLRLGRIDRKIEFPSPGPEARVSILKIHSRKISLQRGIDLKALAEKMGQCSGAEVHGICTEAGMYALRERRQHVTQEDFEFAIAKVLKKNQEGNTSVNKLFS